MCAWGPGDSSCWAAVQFVGLWEGACVSCQRATLLRNSYWWILDLNLFFFYFPPSSRITGSSFITISCCLKDVSQERNSKKDSWTISSGAQVHQEVDKVGKGFMTCFTKSTHQQCLCWEVPITIPDAGITLAWLNEPSIICYRIMVWGEHQAQQFIFIAQPPVCSSRSS